MKFPVYLCLAFAVIGCAKQEVPSSGAPAPTMAAAPASTPMDAPAGVYRLDPAHSSLLFRVDHLGFSKYTGRFRTFDAQLQLDPDDLAASSVEVTVDPTSLDVENPPAGFVQELIGANWLDADTFPTLTYRSTAVEVIGPRTVRITGDLTLHGVTKPVVLEATLNGGYSHHPFEPQARIGFSARGTFKRSDFGIAAGIPAPGTTMGVGDEVEVIVETELNGPEWTGPTEATPST